MTMVISTLCFSLAAVLLVGALRRRSDLFSPARVFIIVWSTAVGLADLKLSAFQREWSIEAWGMVLLGPVSFLVGVFCVQALRVNKPLLSLDEVRYRLRIQPLDANRLFGAIVVGVLLYVISYTATYLAKGFIPLFSGSRSRTEFQIFFVGVFPLSIIFILYFVIVYYVMVVGNKNRKRILMLLGFFCGITYLALLSRFPFVMVALVVLPFLYYSTHRINYKTLVAFAVTSLSFFFLVTTLRTGQLVQVFIYRLSKMKYSSDYAFFTEPYMYIVMNLENLAVAVTRHEKFTYGYYTFDFVFALTGLKHWMSAYFNLDPTPYLISGSFNSYSAFWTFYRDFGVIGTAVIPFLLGFFFSTAYHGMRSNPTLTNVTLYSIAVYVMVISFFYSPIGFLWFVYNAVAISVILKYISSDTYAVSQKG